MSSELQNFFKTDSICFSVYTQLLDRKQQRLQLVLLPLDAFVTSPPEDSDLTPIPVPFPTVQVIYVDTSNVWVNVSNYLHVNFS